jgi:hypothetical protein
MVRKPPHSQIAAFSLSATAPSTHPKAWKGRPFALDHSLAQGGLLAGKWRVWPDFARNRPGNSLHRGNDTALPASGPGRSIFPDDRENPAGLRFRPQIRFAGEAS